MSASSTGNTITFTYTAATGGVSNGAVTLVVPSGWSAPSTTGSAAGFTTASTGTVAVSSQTITVSGVTVSAGNTFTIVYGSTASSGPGATATSTLGAQTWQAQEKSTSGGTLTNLASSPPSPVNASADGSGTLTTPTTTVLASSTGNTITFTYTAATGGISSGAVPWSFPRAGAPPQRPAPRPASPPRQPGPLPCPPRRSPCPGLTLSSGSQLTIVYGSKASSGPGATAASTLGAQTWQAQEKSTTGGTLTNLASSPSITVNASADGSGTLTTPTTTVLASSTGNTITFTYTAATGGMSNGAVTLVVPSGWSAPSTTGSAAGFTTASTGTVAVSCQTITVSGVTLSGGGTSPSSTAPRPRRTGRHGGLDPRRPDLAGPGEIHQRRHAHEPRLLALDHCQRPADGSGTLTTPTTTVLASSTGNTITFTYTAATGG